MKFVGHFGTDSPDPKIYSIDGQSITITSELYQDFLFPKMVIFGQTMSPNHQKPPPRFPGQANIADITYHISQPLRTNHFPYKDSRSSNWNRQPSIFTHVWSSRYRWFPSSISKPETLGPSELVKVSTSESRSRSTLRPRSYPQSPENLKNDECLGHFTGGNPSCTIYMGSCLKSKKDIYI